MNLIKKYLWNLEGLFDNSRLKRIIAFQILGIIFIGYVIFSSLGMDAKSIKDSSLELYEVIIICSYLFLTPN